MKKLYMTGLLALFAASTITAQTTVTVDFEDRTLGNQELAIGWGGMEAIAADDPLATGNTVLQFTPNNYNAAPAVEFTLAAGTKLSDYSKFSFQGYFAQGDVGWKEIIVYAYDETPTGPAFDKTTTGTQIGTWNRALGASTAWETIEIDLTAVPDFEGTVFIAFGFNCDGTQDEVTTIWYADDVSLVGTTTSIPTAVAQSPAASIISKAEGLQIVGLQNNNVTVYSLTGTKVFEQSAANGELSIALPGGLYMVQIDNETSKALVK